MLFDNKSHGGGWRNLKKQKRGILFLGLAILMVAIDQGLKIWATTSLKPIGQAEFIPGILGLRYILNDGMAFSMFSGATGLLVTVTSVALLAMAGYIFLKKPTGLVFWAISLMFSGGLGNLVDRIRTGVVVDYLEFQFISFPIFNFADILVTIGAGLLFLWAIFDTIQEKKKTSSHQEQIHEQTD